jgi:DNA polymerase elongation subunit (family B)
MKTAIALRSCTFFDIETATRYRSFEEFKYNEPKLADIWLSKAEENEKYKDSPEESYLKNASLYAEYGMVVSICVGYYDVKTEGFLISELSIKNYENRFEEERTILKKFNSVMSGSFKDRTLAGFNIKGFDVPYIYKRTLINKILPSIKLDIGEKKPWELQIYDLMNEWHATSNVKGMTNFDLICTLMGVKSPKEGEVKGENVNENFHNGNINQIIEYCKRDVDSTIKLALSLSVEELVN